MVATEDPTKDENQQPDSHICIPVTLLLITGLRVSLKIDNTFISEHLLSHSSPLDISISGLKSALFSSWKNEWGTAPVSSSNIRLIYYGKVLEDGQTLQNCQILPDSSHNVLHMSVKPASFELDSSTKPSRNAPGEVSGENGSNHGSRCCIIT